MEQRNVGIPRRAGNEAEPQRMVFREAKIIRTALVRKSKRTRGIGAPRVRRNQIERGLQLWVDPGLWLSGLLHLFFDIHWIIRRQREDSNRREWPGRLHA
jgi:hypothetical protein